jgi:hypothetical protein
LLRARDEWPERCGTTQKRDELAPLHGVPEETACPYSLYHFAMGEEAKKTGNRPLAAAT